MVPWSHSALAAACALVLSATSVQAQGARDRAAEFRGERGARPGAVHRPPHHRPPQHRPPVVVAPRPPVVVAPRPPVVVAPPRRGWYDPWRGPSPGASLAAGVVGGLVAGSIAAVALAPGQTPSAFPVGTHFVAPPNACQEVWVGRDLFLNCPDGSWLRRVVVDNQLYFVRAEPPR